MPKSLTEKSKFLSYVLRHRPDDIGILLETEGWATIQSLITGAAAKGVALDTLTIAEIVATNDKKRFELSSDGKKIRAVQGHSNEVVDRKFMAKTPPDVLFHGTAEKNLRAIMSEGLTPQKRQHVHLSANFAVAKQTGARHGKPVVLAVDAKRMAADGASFYQAENGVWLTGEVAAVYLRESAQ
jgi:putative RNA 2'-phosphotransferase